MDIKIRLEDPYFRCIIITLEPTGLTLENVPGCNNIEWHQPVFIHHSQYHYIKHDDKDGRSLRAETKLVNGIIMTGLMEYNFLQACITIQTAMFINN